VRRALTRSLRSVSSLIPGRGTACHAPTAALRPSCRTTAWPLDGSRAEVLVALENGQQLVPLTPLIRQDEGRYLCPWCSPSWWKRSVMLRREDVTIERLDLECNEPNQ
jgi:hypothetical protein